MQIYKKKVNCKSIVKKNVSFFDSSMLVVENLSNIDALRHAKCE